jgi:NAD(P)-dependent dehydrogenase (short-subunit alcohol dehydrogenase family)
MGLEYVAQRFSGKSAIVTGAGSGIGKATAKRLAQEGARVIATDVVQARLDALADELRTSDVTAIQGDIARDETVAALVAAANGRVDVLANVAGIMDAFQPVGEVDDQTWDRVLAVNLTAVFRLTRAVIPLMLSRQSGSIVNVASEAGLRGSAAGAAYTSSKHALIGLTKNTAFMYAPNGIRVNAVAPGPVRTGIEAQMKSQLAAARVGPLFQTALPPIAEPERLAAAITWLASDDAMNVTGIVLASDGGWSAL